MIKDDRLFDSLFCFDRTLHGYLATMHVLKVYSITLSSPFCGLGVVSGRGPTPNKRVDGSIGSFVFKRWQAFFKDVWILWK